MRYVDLLIACLLTYLLILCVFALVQSIIYCSRLQRVAWSLCVCVCVSRCSRCLTLSTTVVNPSSTC